MVGVNFGRMGDTEQVALAREQAIRESKMSFIELRLLKAGFNGACGAEVLSASQYTDPATQAVRFNVSVVGEPLRFIQDTMRGGSFCFIPDTEWNRDFLRGVMDSGVVDIVNKELEAKIKAKEPAPVLSGVPVASTGLQTEEELTAALNKIRAAKGLPPIGAGGQPPLASLAPAAPNPVVLPDDEVFLAAPPAGNGANKPNLSPANKPVIKKPVVPKNGLIQPEN